MLQGKDQNHIEGEPKNRMKEIANKWKEVPDEQKKAYADDVKHVSVILLTSIRISLRIHSHTNLTTLPRNVQIYTFLCGYIPGSFENIVIILNFFTIIFFLEI